MGQAQGKRRAQPQGSRGASAPKSSRGATSQYQGRRAAEKTSSFALPLLRFPAVGFARLNKPVAAASVAVAGLVGVGAVATSGQTAPQTVQAEQVERGPLGTAPITVAASPADEAVMSAAEVLNRAVVLQGDNEAIARAASELEALLADLETQASTSAPESTRSATASRSYSRESLDDASLASLAGESVTTADGSASETPKTSDDLDDADSDLKDSGLKDSADQGIADSGESASDLPSELVVQKDTSYVAKHALKAPADVTESQVQIISEDSDTTVAVTDNTAELPIGDVTVVVELSDSHLTEVKDATERLQALLENTSAITVQSADEVEEEALEAAWASAIKAESKIGTYSNGKIPLSALTELASVPGHYARDDAAIMFAELNRAFKAEFGRNIKMTDSYRSYSSQVATKANKGWLAAPPGYSNHGWGLALDIAGPESQWNTTERNWMVKNAPTYGWISPDWAQTTKPEPWHWEYAGPSVSSVGRQVAED